MLSKQGGEAVLLALVREPETNLQVSNIADQVRIIVCPQFNSHLSPLLGVAYDG